MNTKQVKQKKNVIELSKGNLKVKMDESESDDDDESPSNDDEEIETQPQKQNTKNSKNLLQKKHMKQNLLKKLKKNDDGSSEEDDDDDAQNVKINSDSDDEDSDDKDSDDDNDKDSNDNDDVDDKDSDDDDEKDEDSESEDDEDEEGDAKPGQKRKAKTSTKPDHKKAKLESEKSTEGLKTLFVGKLSKDTTESNIKTFFEKNGISVGQIRRHKGKQFAHVDVTDAHQLEAALKLSGKKLEGSHIDIQEANHPMGATSPPSASKKMLPRDEETNKRKLFVKEIPFGATDDQIKKHFPLAQDIDVPRKTNGKLKGHAYITFESEAVLEKVKAELQNSKLGGRSLVLQYVGQKKNSAKSTTVQNKVSDESGKTLCVKQLSFKTSKEQLMEFFKKSTDARIVKDTNSGKSQGFGFVVFDTHEDAQNAMTKMQGKALNGRNLVLSFSYKKKSKPGKNKGPNFKRKSEKNSEKGMNARKINDKKTKKNKKKTKKDDSE